MPIKFKFFFCKLIWFTLRISLFVSRRVTTIFSFNNNDNNTNPKLALFTESLLGAWYFPSASSLIRTEPESGIVISI